MKKSNLARLKLPDSPGVYFFLGTRKKILYIGKATTLNNRVRSYFSPDIVEKRSPLIQKMVDEAVTVEFTKTDSVLEALILETNLIRTHKPFYNTKSKDDKSYNHLVITDEEFPRVLIVRGKDLTEKFSEEDIKYHFGPFPNSTLFKEALKITRKLFQFYDSKAPVGEEKGKFQKGKIDFNKQIGLYPSVHSKAEYSKTIRHIKLFFQGKKDQVIRELSKDMMHLAKSEKFEEADVIKRRIFALKHIQDVSLIKDENRTYRSINNIRIEAYDIAHLQGSDMVGVMVVLEGEEPARNEYRKFKIQNYVKANDTGALKEVLERRFKHSEWSLPQIVVVDGAVAQKKVAESVIKDHGLTIPVIAVVKDNKHKPIRLIGPNEILGTHKYSILLANSESHRFAITYHRSKRSHQLNA